MTSADTFVAIAASAATRLGVTDALATPQTLEQLAARLGLAQRRLGPLVDLLVGGGRLVRSNDEHSLGASGNEEARGAALVETVLRRDRPFDRATDPWSLQTEAAALDVRPLLSVGAMDRALDAIDDLASTTIFLDAGGGLGDATRGFLARSKGRAILVDVPPIVEAAKRHLAAFSDRITFVAADLRTAELPRCDLAFVSNVLHLHGDGDADSILRSVVRASRDRVVVRDVLLDDDRRGPLAALAFALATVIFGDGQITTSTYLKTRMENSGLGRVTLCSRGQGEEWAMATGTIR